MNIKTFGCVHPSYQCITVMRCLHLKKSNPEVWKLLMELESHCDQRKGTYKWENDKVQVAQFSRNFFKIEEQFSEDDIMKMCGIVQVKLENCITINFKSLKILYFKNYLRNFFNY